jgi:transposase
VCFPFHSSRSADFVCQALGIKPVVNAVLLTDGYAAYAQYAQKTGIHHARCWAHGRRTFFEALTAEPTAAAEALEQIKALYAVEEEIRDAKLTGDTKQLHRLTHSKPLVELFFEWVDRQLQRQGFTPTNPFIQALNYVRERRVGLELFLTDPDVPIDTNHLERALRVVPMGRKSWLFCWTELGAKHVGIIQSLIVTCRQHFAVNPLRSDIHDFPSSQERRILTAYSPPASRPRTPNAALTRRLLRGNSKDDPLQPIRITRRRPLGWRTVLPHIRSAPF